MNIPRILKINILALLVMGNLAHATIDVDTSGLTEGQKAQLVQKVEEMKTAAATKVQQGLTPEKVNEWTELGKNISIAFTTVAKDLGVAADQFINSTTGKVTLALIVWKVAGHDILHLIIGVLFLTIFIPLWVYFFRRLCLMKSIVVEPVEGHKRPKRTVEYFEHPTGDIIATRWVMLFVLCGIVGVGLLVAL